MSLSPEIGQTVLVRGRPYIVENISPQALAGMDSHGQHLVELTCLDENSLDEKLSVIWELEPGAEIRSKSSMPSMDRFDDPEDLEAFIHAVRWGIVSQMDSTTMQAPFRSGVEPDDYQLEPVARALTMPRVNLLLADDVGLGKTIEAGLIVQELLLRNRARSVLIVCPSSLQYQWKSEMLEKFGLEFRIVNRELVRRLRRERGIHANPWKHFPRLITSIDYFKQDRVFRSFAATLPSDGKREWPRRYDILIIDEAHNIAPSGSDNYAKATQRTKAIRTICPHFEHKLFLSATPHNGYRQSFSALLELLDDQRFIRSVEPDKESLAKAMVRRLKDEIKNADGSPRFPKRIIKHIEVEYTEEECTIYALFQKYWELCMKNNETDYRTKMALYFVLVLLKKRLFSSPFAFFETLKKHAEHRWIKETGKANTISYPDLDETTEEEDAEAVDEALIASSHIMSTPDEEEARILKELMAKVEKASLRADTKAQKLVSWLKEKLCPNGEWNDTRVVIFTEYRDTQAYLVELFTAHKLLGSNGERLAILHGGVQNEDREHIKAAFQAPPSESPVRILLGTDAASEGINLQNHCSLMVHYEIPWNPVRLEQRNGRIDRHGQKAPEVNIYHFVCADYEKQITSSKNQKRLYADLDFLHRVVSKVENIRLDLGKVGPVIAKQIVTAMLNVDSGKHVLDTTKAEMDAKSARTLLKIDRDLRKILQDVNAQMDASRLRLQITPENIKHTVDVALRLTQKPPLIPAKVRNIPDGEAFFLPQFKDSWAQCLEGNANPFTGNPRPVVFNGDLCKHREDVALVHLNHKLVTMSLGILRAQLWASEHDCKLNRTAIRVVPTSLTAVPVAVIFGRIIVVGSTNQRIWEEMIMAGGRVREGRFSRMNVSELETFWKDGIYHTRSRVTEGIEHNLAELGKKIANPLYQSLEVRCEERTKNLASIIERHVGDETARVRAVMGELERLINDELDRRKSGPQIIQLTLFDLEEQAEFRADTAVLERKLKIIAEEREKEIAYLQKRYAGHRPLLYPLAVTWFIPEKYLSERGL